MSDEFDIIQKYFLPLTQGFNGAFSLSDDAAVISPSDRHELVITTDTIVCGVHYLEDEAMANVAAKLMASNLSDLAAMGAKPRGFTLSCAWHRGTSERQIQEFASEMSHWVGCFDFPLLGGDTVTTPGTATFTLSAMGEVPLGKALRRCGAKPGDTVYVTGTIGDGALGLEAAQEGLPGLTDKENEYLANRYRRPTPRVDIGQSLLGIATAAIDISDGLLQDMGHIALASGVNIEIRHDAVPLSDAAKTSLESDRSQLGKILTGGDDYEIAFTSSEKLPDAILGNVCAIGLVSEGPGEVRCVNSDGLSISFNETGYNHFS